MGRRRSRAQFLRQSLCRACARHKNRAHYCGWANGECAWQSLSCALAGRFL